MDQRNLPAEEQEELSKIINELYSSDSGRNYSFLKYEMKEIKDVDPEVFFSIIDAIAHPALIIDPLTGQILHGNPAAERFYGYTTAELSEMNIGLISCYSPALLEKIRLESVYNGRTYILAPHKLKNGDIRLVDVFINPIVLDNKRYNFFFINDATEALLARHEANLKYEEINRVLNGIPDTVVLYDRNGVINYFKPSRSSQFRDFNLVGKSVRDLGLPDETLDFILDLIERTLNQSDILTVDFDSIDYNGNKVFYSMESVPLSDKQVLLIAKDVTENVLWKEKENRYNLILENMSDAVIVYELESEKYVDCNETASKIFGYTKQELIGMKRQDLVAEPDKLRLYKNLDQFEISNIKFRCKNGEIKYCDEKAYKAELNEVQVMIVIINDVTDLVKISEELRNYNTMNKNGD